MDEEELDISELYLCKNVPFNNTYENTIDFETQSKQLKFFESYNELSMPIHTTYLRLNRFIKVGKKLDQLFGINYCYCKNPDGKWYFYFISDKQYINEEVTRIEVEMDVAQTYMFNYTLGECFVGREHQDRYVGVSNKIRKFNIEPENIEIGNDYGEQTPPLELKGNVGGGEGDPFIRDVSWYYVWTTKCYGNYVNSYVTLVNGKYTNTYLFLVPNPLGNRNVVYSNKTFTHNNTKGVIQALRQDNATVKIELCNYLPFHYSYEYNSETGNYELTIPDFVEGKDNIVSINNLANYPSLPAGDNLWYLSVEEIYYVQRSPNAMVQIAELLSPYSTNVFNNATLGVTKHINRESKLLTYPYSYKKLTYGNSTIDLYNEYFNSSVTPTTPIWFMKSLYPSSSATIMPGFYLYNYIGMGHDLTASEYGEIALTTDAYVNYANTKRATLTAGLLVDVGQGFFKTATATYAQGVPGGINEAVNTVANVANTIIKVQDLKHTPDYIRSTGDDIGTVEMFTGNYAIIRDVEILPQFKEKVFNYLYHYGYKCNSYKTPDLKSRYYFNFIQLVDTVIKSSQVDSDYIDKLKSIYQNGITIWHYRGDGTTADIESFKTNTLYNYNLENWETSLNPQPQS